MLSIVSSGALQGITGCSVQVEVNTGEVGELRFTLAGFLYAAINKY